MEETHINSYKLDQGNDVYIFSTSIVGNSMRMTIKKSNDINNQKVYRDFNIEQLKQINDIFNFIKEPHQASIYIDKILRNQKVGVTEEGGKIKITFYITIDGITRQIDIPLGELINKNINEPFFQSSGNQFLSLENNSNYQPLNININSNTTQNDIETILKASFGQPNPEENDLNKYFDNFNSNTDTNININSYESNINQYIPNSNLNENNFNINQFLGTSNINTNGNIQYMNNIENPPIITSVENSTNKYISSMNDINSPIISNQQFVHSLESTSNIGINNNNQILHTPYKEQYEENKSIITSTNPNIINNNQYTFSPSHNIVSTPMIHSPNIKNDFPQEVEHAEVRHLNNPLHSPLNTTHVLPIQSTTKILPPIGPFNSLNGLDLHELANINSQKQVNSSPYINMQTFQTTNQEEVHQSIVNSPSQNNIMTNQQNQIISNINNDNNLNINNINIDKNNIVNNDYKTNEEINILRKENMEMKKKLSELKNIKNDSEEVKALRNKLAELEPLKKKISEMEVLRSQLTELNTLRAQIAEYNAIKGQLKEVNNLRTQIKQMNELKAELSEMNSLKKKADELDSLRIKVKELEKIKEQYEEEIKSFKENEQLYLSIKSKQSKEDSKEMTYEEEDQQSTTVKGDIIHDTNELELLTKKINKSNNKLTLNLLYKATADGDKAEAFHAKCDDAKSSIVLVETDKGKRFGGFTTCSWSGDCIDKKDEEAFVFSLDKMKTYDNIPGEDAIGCYPKFGPIFLGCQIRIYDNAFSKGGTTFEGGLNYNTEEDYELTGGDRNFNIKDIEVYEVIKED